MEQISDKDEKRLVAYLYDGGFNQTMRICLDIGVSYASIMRYRGLPDPLGKLRYFQLRNLITSYEQNRGQINDNHEFA